MKLCLIVLLYAVFHTICIAQITKADSAQIDSLKEKLVINDRIDSINTFFGQNLDSIRAQYSPLLLKIDSAQTKLQTLANLPFDKVEQLRDSLNRKIEVITHKINNRLDSIQRLGNAKLVSLNLPPELTDKASIVSKRLTSQSLPSVGQLKIGDLALPSIPASNFNVSISSLNQSELTNELASKVPNFNGVGKYTTEASKLSEGIKMKPADASKMAEAKLADLSQLSKMEKQANGLSEYHGMATKYKDPNVAKEEAVDKIQQAAYDHFSGKEKILEQGMDKLAKYKKKYTSLNSVANRPRFAPNLMKHRPFGQRLIPGLTVQISKHKPSLAVDIFPSLAYRVTGKFNLGLGWTQRIGYNLDNKNFNHKLDVYGPRTYIEFNAWRGFYPRVEGEMIKVYVPIPNQTPKDIQTKEWVPGMFVGIKKEYPIFKNLKGNMQVMTRLFHNDKRNPYSSLINIRVGFELPRRLK